MAYSIYSNFDIEQHKKTFTHYLEVVIDESGKIMYAVPSHQEKMISLACEKLNVTREELNAMCPKEYYCDFMTWICKMSGACAVWENFIVCDKLTEQQIKALQMLKENGLYLGKSLEWRIIMRKELIDKANDIIRLIEKNESAIEELSKHVESGCSLFAGYKSYGHGYNERTIPDRSIDFEDWEIRLMIHQKKQRINALKVQLERL